MFIFCSPRLEMQNRFTHIFSGPFPVSDSSARAHVNGWLLEKIWPFSCPFHLHLKFENQSRHRLADRYCTPNTERQILKIKIHFSTFVPLMLVDWTNMTDWRTLDWKYWMCDKTIQNACSRSSSVSFIHWYFFAAKYFILDLKCANYGGKLVLPAVFVGWRSIQAKC
jgi:hypothetical protein